jgi:tetratricopeptide (TPR) repeat protein
MKPTPDLFALAVQHHQSGNLVEAERLFRQVVKADASHTDAWRRLGLTCLAMGKMQDAEQCFREALRLAPGAAGTHCELGIALAQQQKLKQAAESFREAVRLEPALAPGHNNLGLALMRQGRLDEAIAALRRAIQLSPSYAAAHNNLGLALAARGQVLDAVECFQRALQFDRNYANARANLNRALGQTGPPPRLQAGADREAGAFTRKGVQYFREGRLQDAMAAFQQAISIKPDHAEAHRNLGGIFCHQGRDAEAVASYRRALELNPRSGICHSNLGNVLAHQEKFKEAEAYCREAVRLQPADSGSHNNLANALKGQGRLEEAVASYQEALRLQPNFPEAHHNLGLVLLEQNRVPESLDRSREAVRLKSDYAPAHFAQAEALLALGDLGAGFPEYEWRLKCKEFVPRFLPGPVWDGSPLRGRTILLYAEQGLGDTIQFIRYAPLVKQLGGTVVVECQAALVPLLGRTGGVDRLIERGSPLPAYDVQASLLSLPAILRTTSETIPASVPYVLPDDRLVEQWRQELNAVPGFRVGISWQGSREHKKDRFRSMPLYEFEPLAGVAGVRLISLQKGAGTEQLAALGGRFAMVDWSSQLDEASAAFMDTAALMKVLDLVIVSDSANAHLAGALEVPVWVVLPFAPDWRWQLDREDSPWYPTMRLFRPRERGKWGEVFQRIAGELKKLVKI